MSVLQQAPEELFWYWISERHSIFLKRQQGLPKPWTTDPILRDYKFTNPFRENDRGTVWLRENFLDKHREITHSFLCDYPLKTQNEEDCSCGMFSHVLSLVAFNICFYRMFNWWGTGERIGWQTKWEPNEVKAKLELAMLSGEQVFTGAHIVYSPPGRQKIDAIVDVCSDLYYMCFAAGALITCAREEKRLQTVFEALTMIHCVGGFMAYEMVSDMRHTRLLEDATDIMTWANPGPGAKRGLQRLGKLYKRDTEAIQSMRELLLDSQFSECGSPRKYCSAIRLGSHVPQLEMRDIEHSLCEFDKYCRVKFGEGLPRGRFNGRA